MAIEQAKVAYSNTHVNFQAVGTGGNPPTKTAPGFLGVLARVFGAGEQDPSKNKANSLSTGSHTIQTRTKAASGARVPSANYSPVAATTAEALASRARCVDYYRDSLTPDGPRQFAPARFPTEKDGDRGTLSPQMAGSSVLSVDPKNLPQSHVKMGEDLRAVLRANQLGGISYATASLDKARAMSPLAA